MSAQCIRILALRKMKCETLSHQAPLVLNPVEVPSVPEGESGKHLLLLKANRAGCMSVNR